MPSERQKTTGYPLPEVIQPYPLIDVCLKIPDAPEYRAAFYGAVYALSKWYSWEKTWSHGDTRATEAAEMWRQILVQYLMIGEECNAMAFQLRQNPTNTCQMQQSTDGGITWTLAFDFSLCQPTAPVLYNINNQITQNTLTEIFNRYDGSNVQTININAPADFYNGDSSADRDMALCMAVKAYIASQAAEYASYARLVLGVAGVFAVVGGFIPIIGTIAIELTAAMLAAVSIGVLEALTDAQALNDVTCCMVAGLTGQAVTYANWTGSLNACGFASGSHAEFVRVSIAQSFDSQKNWTSFINTLGNAYLQAQAGVEDCPECCEPVDFLWDWYSGANDLTGWSVGSTADIDPALITACNDATATYHMALQINADGMGHNFVANTPPNSGYGGNHCAITMYHDFDTANCALTGMEVLASVADNSSSSVKLWVHGVGGWRYATGIDITGVGGTPVTRSVAFHETDVDKVAFLTYSGSNVYVGKLKLTIS